MTNYESNQSTIFNLYTPLNNFRNSIFSFSNYRAKAVTSYDPYFYYKLVCGIRLPKTRKAMTKAYWDVLSPNFETGLRKQIMSFTTYKEFTFVENVMRVVSLSNTLLIATFLLFTFFVISSNVYSFLNLKKNFLNFLKINKLIKQSVLVNLNFVTTSDVVTSFFLIFVTVYFLEIHWFFFNFFELTSDNSLYTFNFLLSGFLFVFLYKFIYSTLSQNTFIVFNNVMNNMYYLFKVDYKTKVQTQRRNHRLTMLNYFTLFRYFLVYKINILTLFFLSTFLVWFLRYVIQFVRLAVLFLIHTIFELIVFSYDQYLILWVGNALTWVTYVFFCFFYFGLFLYFILYLNLMLSLQIFIFFFFTEVFQQNFAIDLAVTVKSNYKSK